MSSNLPREIPKDWSKLNTGQVFLSSYIDGVQHFTIGWEATALAELFPQLDAGTSRPRPMNWRHMRQVQEMCRQSMISDYTQENVAASAAMLAWLGLLCVERNDYNKAITALKETGAFYIHVIYAVDQWVFYGSEIEESEDVLAAIMRTAYRSKFMPK